MHFLKLSTRFCLSELQLVMVLAAAVSVGASAQTTQSTPPLSATHLPPLIDAQEASVLGCPAAMTAMYIPGAALRPVDPGTPGEARKPLQLSFGLVGGVNGLSERIVQVQVTIRGISEKGGVIPAGEAGSRGALLNKKFSVNVAVNPAGLQSGTVWLTGYGGVSDVLVDSVTYSNGRVWKPAANETCRARMGVVLTAAR